LPKFVYGKTPTRVFSQTSDNRIKSCLRSLFSATRQCFCHRTHFHEIWCAICHCSTNKTSKQVI